MRWFGRNRRSDSTRLALQWRADGLACAYCKGDRILGSGVWPAEKDLAATVASLVQQRHLQGKAATLLLGGGSYQVVQVPTPSKVEERAAAYGEQIRDMIDYPLAQAVVDGFVLPDDAYRGRQKLSYAIATPRAPLAAMAKILMDNDLALDRVEIPELAVNALLAQQSGEGPGAALVFVDGEQSWVSLHQGGNLYLARSVDITHDGLTRQGAFDHRNMRDSLALELQRTMDFYDSQLGKGVVRSVWLAPGPLWGQEVSDHLQNSLGIPCKPLSIADISQGDIAGQDPACFVVEAALLAGVARDARLEHVA